MKNYYEILGIRSTASKEEIKEAYIKLSKKVHPDVNSGDDFFSEFFKNINEAHNVLTDDTKRAAYHFKYNNYFFDYNFLREKERELQKKEEAIRQRKMRSKMLFKGSISLFAGFAAIAVLLVSFDIYKEPEDLPVRKNTRPLLLKQNDKVNIAPAVHHLQPNHTAASKPIPAVKKKMKLPADVKHLQTKPKSKLHSVAAIKTAVTISKQLNMEEMKAIEASIVADKIKAGNKADCIHVIKSAGSNISNASELVRFLQSKGFTISGRETIPQATDGIKIDCKADCILLTIGRVK